MSGANHDKIAKTHPRPKLNISVASNCQTANPSKAQETTASTAERKGETERLSQNETPSSIETRAAKAKEKKNTRYSLLAEKMDSSCPKTLSAGDNKSSQLAIR